MKLSFLIFVITVTLWSFSLYFYSNPVLLDSWQWLRIIIFLSVVSILELFNLVFSAASVPFKKIALPLAISIILGLALILTVFLSLDLKNYLVTLHPRSFILLLSLFMYGALGIAILFERRFRANLVNQVRAVYILVASGIFIMILTSLYVFLPLVTGRDYPWLGPVLSILFLLSSLFGYYWNKEIAKRKEAEKLAQERAELTQVKDQFLLSLQHHLRTPLGPIKGYLEMILAGTYGREENPTIREKLIEIKKLVDTLYSLIESLLDIQALKTGQKALDLESCQIEILIAGIIEELKPHAEEKGLYLKLELNDETNAKLPIVELDKKRIREAIWNLVDNAVKYTNRGGITIKLDIQKRQQAHSLAKERWLKIGISDSGIGMSKKEIDYFLQGKLFERGQEAKKLYGPGRGIGLSIAVEFIKAHGGKIWAESAGWGKGTTFWIEFPIK